MNGIPEYLVLPDKVNALTAKRTDGGRAFDRMIVEYLVEGINPMSDADTWSTRLGMSRELSDDYPSFKEATPIDGVLSRFLCHFVRTNSIHVLSGNNGQVLTSTSYKDYLGHEPAEEYADLMLPCLFKELVLFRQDVKPLLSRNKEVLSTKQTIYRHKKHN